MERDDDLPSFELFEPELRELDDEVPPEPWLEEDDDEEGEEEEEALEPPPPLLCDELEFELELELELELEELPDEPPE